MTRLVLILFLLAAACGGGGGGEADLLAAPHVAGELLVLLQDPDDVDEVEELRQDFAALEITRVGLSSVYRLRFPGGTDLARLLKELRASASWWASPTTSPRRPRAGRRTSPPWAAT